jgi:hypothetical protein
MKTMYAVMEDKFEFNLRPRYGKRYATIEECYMDRDDHDSRQVALFETIEEALECLAKIAVHSDLFCRSEYHGRANVAYIEEGNYDRDEDDEDAEWEFIDGCSIYAFKCEELETIDEEDEEDE